MAKARYDSETFWYLPGNGSPEVVSDVSFEANKYKNRCVILYGNADTNAQWASLLGSSPVQVRRGEISIGERKMAGDDLTCLLLRPIAGAIPLLSARSRGQASRACENSNNLPYLPADDRGFPDDAGDQFQIAHGRHGRR